MNYYEESIKLHEKLKGKIEVKSKIPLETKEDLSLLYTPGVAEPCIRIAKDKALAYDYTIKSNTIAVISDGTAVLGLGDIGPEAAMPVMEGKSLLFKEFAGVNAFPLVLNTKDTEEIIRTIKAISPGLGGINLEDISAPRCFEIEERLKNELDIPVFHDDQHGTAIVALAGLINSLKITGKDKSKIKVVISGLGAAGTAITKLLNLYGVKEIIVCDSKAIVSKDRTDLNNEKKALLTIINPGNISGTLKDALIGADVFVGVSAPNLLDADDVKRMAKDPIIFAMANPVPEIMPDIAKAAGARIVATGRSDFPNQLNNVLVFPGIFAGALKYRISKITDDMKIKAAEALASYVKDLNEDNIIPNPLDKKVAEVIAESLIS